MNWNGRKHENQGSWSGPILTNPYSELNYYNSSPKFCLDRTDLDIFIFSIDSPVESHPGCLISFLGIFVFHLSE